MVVVTMNWHITNVCHYKEEKGEETTARTSRRAYGVAQDSLAGPPVLRQITVPAQLSPS